MEEKTIVPDFGVVLRMIREQAGLSREKFAELIDVSAECISNYESGKTVPVHEKLLKIEKLSEYGFSRFSAIIE